MYIEYDKIGLIIIVIALTSLLFYTMRKLRKVSWKKSIFEYLIFCLYIFSFLLFLLAFAENGSDYRDAIDPVDSGYSPFGIKQFPTLLFYFFGFWISGLLLWVKKEKLSPFIKLMALSFLCIGVGISAISVAQVTFYNDLYATWSMCQDPSIVYLFSIYPMFNIVLAVLLIVACIRQESTLSVERVYKNQFLNLANQLLIKIATNPVWLIVLLLPFLFVCTLILIVFGQSPDSLVKAFTETTCWRFSQMSHPEYLPHQGHYLCTVAACGSEKIVKPIRIGQRHGTEIIVNRQLMVANAFEEVIENSLPNIHRIIRRAYDNYGLPLSKYINTTSRSNITYLVMKPLEWVFLFVLYIACLHPEDKINSQYLVKQKVDL